MSLVEWERSCNAVCKRVLGSYTRYCRSRWKQTQLNGWRTSLPWVFCSCSNPVHVCFQWQAHPDRLKFLAQRWGIHLSSQFFSPRSRWRGQCRFAMEPWPNNLKQHLQVRTIVSIKFSLVWVLVRTKSAILYSAIVWLWNFLEKKKSTTMGRKRVWEMSNPSLTSEQKVHRMHSASVFCFKLSFGEPSQCLIFMLITEQCGWSRPQWLASR